MKGGTGKEPKVENQMRGREVEKSRKFEQTQKSNWLF